MYRATQRVLKGALYTWFEHDTKPMNLTLIGASFMKKVYIGWAKARKILQLGWLRSGRSGRKVVAVRGQSLTQRLQDSYLHQLGAQSDRKVICSTCRRLHQGNELWLMIRAWCPPGRRQRRKWSGAKDMPGGWRWSSMIWAYDPFTQWPEVLVCTARRPDFSTCKQEDSQGHVRTCIWIMLGMIRRMASRLPKGVVLPWLCRLLHLHRLRNSGITNLSLA